MIEGACHCGQAQWRFNGVPESATICNCSTCRRYAALWAYGKEGVEIEVSGETQTYTWGRKWLAFHFCPHCGCMVYWRTIAPQRHGHHQMGVNVRLAPWDAVQTIPLRRHDTESRDDIPPDGRCVADMLF